MPRTIPIDTSALLRHTQLALNHPSSRLFRADKPVGSLVVLSEENHNLAQSGAQVLIESLDALSETAAAFNKIVSEQQAILQDALSRCRDLIAPIRRLPMEILREVFTFVHQEEESDWVAETPPAVAQVCRLWREVALAMPCFWTTIMIPLDSRKTAGRMERLALWLERCGGSPINLVIDQEEYDKGLRGAQTSAARQMAKVIEPYCTQLVSLSITSECDVAVVSLLQAWHDSETFSMPNLKVFQGGGPYECMEAYDHWDALRDLFCRRAPSVERFMSLTSYDLDAAGGCLDPPTGIRVFIGTISLKGFKRLFTSPLAGGNLEVLEMRGFADWRVFAPLADWHPPLHPPLRNLTSLHIMTSFFPNSTDIDYVPPFPSLRHFILSYGDPRYASMVDVTPMLEVWGAGLDYLGLMVDQESLTAPQVIETSLALCPNLKGLQLGISDYLDMVQRVDFPHLEYCSFHVSNISPTYLVELMSFSARAKSSIFPRLRHLELSFCPSGSDYASHVLQDAVRQLGVEGVVVSFRQRSNLSEIRFDGPYFEGIGGIFDGLYTVDHEWIGGSLWIPVRA